MPQLYLIFLSFLTLFGLEDTRLPPKSIAVKKPNILLILADDLGYADLGTFGSQDLKTPNLDNLTKAGMKLSNFYANSAVCSPTRAALLTGRYQEMVGVPGVIRTNKKDSWGYLAPDAVLLPQVLKNNGYQTALIGKWHLGLEKPNLPNLRGFDYFQGFLGDMMDDYYTHLRGNLNFMRLNTQEITPEGHATDLFTDWSVAYVKNQIKSDRPFFLFLAYNAPHDPIQPVEAWVQKIKKRDPSISDKRAKMLALIEHMDDGVGKVIKALKQTGAYDNTIIVFTSDNGGRLDFGANNGKTREQKATMYEGGLKVPAIMVWPKHIKPGTVSAHLLITMDLFPTLLEAVGMAPREPVDGKSFLRVLSGTADPSTDERPLFFGMRDGSPRLAGKAIDAVRLEDWKLVQNNPFGARELYNLKEDPLEQMNLYSTNRNMADKLSGLLKEHIRLSGAVPWEAPTKP